MTPYPYELEQLARETGVSPLDVLEFYLERLGWRANHNGQDEAGAERDARSDCASYFRGSRPAFATLPHAASEHAPRGKPSLPGESASADTGGANESRTTQTVNAGRVL